MNLQIPEGANVQIFIGNPAPLALADDHADLHAVRRGRGITGFLFKGAAVCLLVTGGFWLGSQHGQQADDAAFAAPPAVNQAFPAAAPADAPPTAAAAPTPGQVPPTFQTQLNQQPSIQPPPGQPSGTPSNGKNPFGLDN